MNMPLTSVTFAEGNSAEVVQSEEKQRNERCSKYLGEAASIENGFNIWTFLKRNAFVMLTLAAVVIGKICLVFIISSNNLSAYIVLADWPFLRCNIALTNLRL